MKRLPWVAWWLFFAAWTVALLLPGYCFDPRVARLRLPGDIPLSKLLHVTSYAILAGTLPRLTQGRRSFWLMLGLLSAHTFATEGLQSFSPARSGSFTDVLIDHGGVALGLLVAAAVWRLGPAAPKA